MEQGGDEHQGLLAPTPEALSSVAVFPLIRSLKKHVVKTIDSALSWDQLTASDINFSIVRPIVYKYARLRNMSIVYACLVVRSYFLDACEVDLAYAGVMYSRAMLCEILAMKLLTHFASNDIQLVAVLTTRWNPLAGATSDVVDQVTLAVGGKEDELDSAPQSALEMAISTKAKAFLASHVSQKVVNDVYYGRIVFSMFGHRSILADNYKSRAIELYDASKSPFIDHYRLRVPFYKNILEFINFVLLLITFVLCLSTQDPTRITVWEVFFIVFASAFTLEEYTTATEHGWIIYIANLWNVFDFSFISIFLAYIILRMKGINCNDVATSQMALDILSCGACILFPRLAFFAVSNNVVILSLRAMVSQFLFFTGIACICFSGLLFTLWTLSQGEPHPRSIQSIAWLMTQIWFGNTSLSFNDASSFHPVIGPILMITFAALSNTLLITILISLLSNTVAEIQENATQEYLFQFAIATMEGVKSDALFSYQPPFNVLAFLILKPASYILTPRALHTFNVFLIKLTSLPTLLLIGIYERYFNAGMRFAETRREAAQSLFRSLPRHIKHMPLVEALVGPSSNDIYDAIFDVEVASELDHLDDSEDDDIPILRSFHSRENVAAAPPLTPRRRRIHSTSNSARGSPRPALNLNLPSPSEPLLSAEGPIPENKSPLAMLFGSRMPSADSQVAIARAEAAVRRVENMVEDIQTLPVQKLKEEMKSLQEQQARIENLLLVLTRGMRNETPVPRRNDSTA